MVPDYSGLRGQTEKLLQEIDYCLSVSGSLTAMPKTVSATSELILAEDTEKLAVKTYNVFLDAYEMAKTARSFAGEQESPAKALPKYQLDQEQAPIIFEMKGDVLKIGVDLLLPRKTSNHTTAKKYYDVLYEKPMEEYFSSHKFHIEPPLVIWYRHCYPDIKGKAVVDYDNMETKIMTDRITKFIGVDDAPQYISVFVSAAESFPARTEIYVMPQHTFLSIFEEHAKTV